MGILKWGISKTIGFNTKMVYIILHYLGVLSFYESSISHVKLQMVNPNCSIIL